MKRERIKDFKEIVLPFFTNYFLKVNYENLGKSDAEEFEKDFSEIIELADKALEQQPCEDTISRQAALDAMDTWDKFGCDPDGKLVRYDDDKHYIPYVHYEDMVHAVKNLPSAQPERIKGHWVEIASSNHTYKCSVCGRLLVNITDGKNNVVKNYPYCHCGADMRGE